MMTGVIAKLLLDTLIIVLLALTISYCWLLNRRIKILQDSRSELAQLLKYFDESTTRASETIVALQAASKKIGENMQGRIEKANYAMDDLNFMIEKAAKLADQLEASFAVSRARTRAAEQGSTPHAARPQADEETPRNPPVLEQHPAIVVQNDRAPAEPAQAERALSNRERTAASLTAVLEKIAGKNGHANGNGARAPERTASRSRAEQELLELLRSGGGMKG